MYTILLYYILDYIVSISNNTCNIYRYTIII